MEGHRSTDKSYPGDDGLISPRGCSPIKVVRELGSERRETVRSLSVAGVGNLRGPVLSTRDRDGHTAGVPVVPPGVSLEVAMYG